jgi:hypothetical protein
MIGTDCIVRISAPSSNRVAPFSNYIQGHFTHGTVVALPIMEACTTRVTSVHRIVQTIGKHIVTQEILSSRGKGICIDESDGAGVVISALQVVEPGFSVSIVVIAVFSSNNIP